MKEPPVPSGREYDHDWIPGSSSSPRDLRPHLPDEIDLTRAPDESVPVVLRRSDDPDGATGGEALRGNIDGFPEPRARGPLRDYRNDPKYASSLQSPDSVRVLVGTAVLTLLSAVSLVVAYNVSTGFDDDDVRNSDGMVPVVPSLERTENSDAATSSSDSDLQSDDVSAALPAVLPDDVSRISSLPTKPVARVKIFRQKGAKIEIVDLEDRPDLTQDGIRRLNEQRMLFHIEQKVLFDAEQEERKELERQKAIEEGRPTEQDWE